MFSYYAGDSGDDEVERLDGHLSMVSFSWQRMRQQVVNPLEKVEDLEP